VESLLERLEARAGALLVARDGGVSLAELREKYASDPVGFAADVLGVTFWDRQQEIALAVRDHAQVAVASGHAVGKDFVGAALSLWWCYVREGLVLVTSATQRQVAEQFFGEVARMFRRANLPGECFQTMLRVPSPSGACGIIGFTSESASSYSGFHGGRVMVILSECQGIPPDAWVGLQSCATGADDRVVALGNPLLNGGRFFDCFRSPTWRTFQISAFDHPNLTGGRFIPGGPTQAWIDRVQAEWGEANAIFQSRVLARFPTESEESVFKRVWLDHAAQLWQAWRAGTGSLRPDGQPFVFSCDPARYGGDLSALAVRRGPVVLEIVCWHGLSTMETVGRLFVEMDRHGAGPRSYSALSAAKRPGLGKPPRIVIDVGGGLGAGPYDRLVEHPFTQEFGFAPMAFNGGQRAVTTTRFANMRAQSYWALRDLLERGAVALPADPLLQDELLAVQWKPNSHGLVQLQPKDEIRTLLGRSPDRADAVTMAYSVGLGYTVGGFTANI